MNKRDYGRPYSLNSSELKGYLTGLIIGDAYITSGIQKRRLELKSTNKDFVEKVYCDLASCTNFKMRIVTNAAYTKDGVNHKESYTLVISAHPYFAKKYHHFYDDNRRRVVSAEAMKWITPAGIANWYMSDGYVCLVGKTKGDVRNRRVDISTDRYSYETNARLSEMMLKRFGIHTSVIKRGKSYRLRVQNESYEDFFSLIAPYVTPSMKYKLYLGYEKKPERFSEGFWEFQDWLGSAIAC